MLDNNTSTSGTGQSTTSTIYAYNDTHTVMVSKGGDLTHKAKPTRIAFGGTVRSLGDGRFAGYLLRYTDPTEKDLYRTYFDEKTNHALHEHPLEGKPILFNHGMDRLFGFKRLGVITRAEIRATPDEHGDKGVWIEWLEERTAEKEKYMQMIDELDQYGRRNYGHGNGLSGGAYPSSVIVDPETGHVDQWIFAEASITHIPGDARNQLPNARLYELNDLQVDLLREELPKEADAAQDNQPNRISKQIRSIRNMDGLVEKLVTIIQEYMDDMQRMDQEDAPDDTERADDDYRMDEEEQRAFAADLAKRIEPTLKALADDAQPTDEQIARAIALQGDTLFEATVERVVKAQEEKRSKRRETLRRARGEFTDRSKSAQAGGHAGGNSSDKRDVLQIRDVTPYDDWSPADYSFAMDLSQQSSGSRRRLIPNGVVNRAFVQQFADKAAKAHQGGEIRLSPEGIRAVNSIRANELDYTTQTGFGDEWVFTSWSDQIWDKPRLDLVYNTFNVVEMPSNPFEVPTESTDPTVYFVGETTDEDQLGRNDSNAAIPDSKIGTNKIQLNAKKHALRVNWSAELDEDAIGTYLPKFREQSQRAIEDALEKSVLLGDTSSSGNINDDGGTPGATDSFMAYDGIVHQALVTATTNAVDAGGAVPTLAHIRSIRSKLGNAQGYNPANLAIFTDFQTYMKLLSIDAVVTMDKLGSQATVLTGSLGQIDGINVFVSGQMALADSDGKITNGGNVVDRGRLSMVYMPDWYVGYRRRIASHLNYLPFADAWELVLTVRTALSSRSYSSAGAQQSSDDSVALLYNIGV